MLFVVSALLASAAAFQAFRFSQSDQLNRTRLASLERESGNVLVTLSEMRGAQMAYLATGQGPDFWMRRATELATQVDSGLTRMRSVTTDLVAHSHLDAASTALADLVQLDGRARSAVDGNQRFLASDIVFADGLGSAQQLAESVRAARNADTAAVEAVLARDRVMQMALVPASLVLVLITAWLAGSSRRSGAPARSEAEELAQMLRDLPPPVKAPGIPATITAPVATPPSAARLAVTPVSPTAETQPAVPALNLPDMAELCVDLARVIDGRDMPALLNRAAGCLGATGIIVWVIDTAGVRLTPALTHGYSERVLSRLGTLEVAADNVTSLSFRSVRPQVMPGDGSTSTSSAVAVPLVTTEGCTGVLSAEVPGQVPTTECVAVARILAAQLAAMLTPVEPSAQQAAQA